MIETAVVVGEFLLSGAQMTENLYIEKSLSILNFFLDQQWVLSVGDVDPELNKKAGETGLFGL